MIKIDDIWIRDPFILKDELKNKFYLYGTNVQSNREQNPNFQFYESDDLYVWKDPIIVFENGNDFWSDRDYWAPEVHFWKGNYYMLASFKAKNICRGTQVLISKSPLGPFVPHSNGSITPNDWECLDGTLYIDENNTPWMIFCHEWVQVKDGRICAIKMNQELSTGIGDPIKLFSASQAPWTRHNKFGDSIDRVNNYVTDGPWLFKTLSKQLLMIWSSFTDSGYAIGISRSLTGDVLGPWQHDSEILYNCDGGHGMIFSDFNNQLLLTCHSPNSYKDERIILVKITETNNTIKCECY